MRRIRVSQAVSAPSKELNWDVESHPITCGDDLVKGYKAIRRTDNNEVLSVVKNSYQMLDNTALKTIMHQLSEMTGFDIVGYSEIQNGKKVLGYLKNNEKCEIAGFKSESYMIVGNSFDKTKAFFVGDTDLLLRCTNQWGHITVNQTVKHIKGIEEEIDQIVRMYQTYVEQQARLKQKYEKWSGIEIPEELRELFVERTLEIDPEDVGKRKILQKENLFQSVNREIAEMGNNAFALFNGATHYSTHVLASKNKVFGNVFGVPANINANAEKTIENLISEYQLV